MVLHVIRVHPVLVLAQGVQRKELDEEVLELLQVVFVQVNVREL